MHYISAESFFSSLLIYVQTDFLVFFHRDARTLL